MRNVIFFHNPEEYYGFLSNWYMSDFTIENKSFSSMEQYMMYKKATLFSDNDVASEILLTSNVGKIKILGRQISNYNESIWNGMRQIIVYKGLEQKFIQNKELQKKLLDTGDSILAESSFQDKVWGIGKSATDTDRFEITMWEGQNLLGYTLMLVRDEIRKNY